MTTVILQHCNMTSAEQSALSLRARAALGVNTVDVADTAGAVSFFASFFYAYCGRFFRYFYRYYLRSQMNGANAIIP